MTVRNYSSTDVNAPVMAGSEAGDLIALLKACLVDGYGDKPGLGWTVAYESGTVCVFRQGGANGKYLRVDDDHTGMYGAAKVRAYETMSDANNGTGATPTVAQQTEGVYWHYRNYIYGQNPRPWFVWGDEKAFYISLGVEDNNPSTQYATYFFGDINSFTPSDEYATLLIGLYSWSSGSSFSSSSCPMTSITMIENSLYGHFIMRAYNQGGGSNPCGKHTDMAKCNQTSYFNSESGQAGMAYPNPADGLLYMSPVWVHEKVGTQRILRGKMPGLWAPCHSGAFNNGDTFDGTGDYAGRKFQALRAHNYMTAVFELSDTWRS